MKASELPGTGAACTHDLASPLHSPILSCPDEGEGADIGFPDLTAALDRQIRTVWILVNRTDCNPVSKTSKR